MELNFSLAHCLCPRSDSPNNDFISIRNHVSNVNGEIENLLHQNLKPLRSFPQVIGVVALQLMIVQIRSHVPKNCFNVSTVHRFEVGSLHMQRNGTSAPSQSSA